MFDRELPDHPSLEQYKKQAKELVRDAALRLPAALDRIRRHHPRLRTLPEGQPISLADAQLVLAREHGFDSWPAFAAHIESLRLIRSVAALPDPVGAFLRVASVDRHGSHGSGTLEHANLILERYPQTACASICAAAVLGDDESVRAFLARDPVLATAPGGPYLWDPLTYLCFSRYLRIEKSRSAAFVRTARALLEAGASASTGWWETIDDPPRQVPETAIYGAAGIAQNPDLTRLLLEYGADPNDEETPYHVPETGDNSTLRVLLDSGRFNERSLATVLVRKADWHEPEGLRLALEHGANPNFLTTWAWSPLQHAIRRDNGLETIALLLDHGADPHLPGGPDRLSAVQIAARRGRADILTLLDRRGLSAPPASTAPPAPLDALIAACARADLSAAQSVAASRPETLADLRSIGGTLLVNFAGNGNLDGIRCLLAFGIPVDAPHSEGDPYWEVNPATTALHNAAWRARHALVAELIALGAPVHARDSKGRAPLVMAVRACTDSYWKNLRRPASVAALLAAGASGEGIHTPTGYDEIDRLLSAIVPG